MPERPAPDVIAALITGESLSRDDTRELFERLLSGGLDEAQIGAILALLQSRGPSVDELAGAATAMRAHVAPVPLPAIEGARVVDTCGTGGAPKTFNVSTAAAFVVAGAAPDPATGVSRVLVPKHGNRSRTGRGSAEVLASLGVNLDTTPEQQQACLERAGVCFCFAVNHHPAMKHAIGPRRSLGVPTIFNLLGPLTNPAGAARQLIGVYKPELVDLIAQTLVALGAERALIVHSHDGLDELTVSAKTRVAHVRDGAVETEDIDPETLALRGASIDELRVESVEDSAALIRSILEGSDTPHADMVRLTAAGALLAAGVVDGWKSGLTLATDAISSGRAADSLERLCETSHAG